MSILGRSARGFACPVAIVVGLSACADDAPDARPLDVRAWVDPAIPMLVHVAWTTEAPTLGSVAFGAAGALDRSSSVESEPTTEHEHTLFGLRANTDYAFQVVVEGGSSSDVGTIRTGPLPTGLPQMSVSGTGGHEGYIVLPVIGATTAVLILDAEGQIVWMHRDDRELDIYRARLSVDGRTLLYNAASVSGDPSDASEIVRIALDGSGQTSIPIPLLAHDFVEHPDGTLGAIVVEYRDFDGQMLRGDKIVEVAPDGTQTTVWTAWDCFDPSVDVGDNQDQGWTFANALDYDPVEQAYYIGMRNFSSITKVLRATGDCPWVFGLTARTIGFAAGADRFLHQHQFELQGNRMLVFDNEGSIEGESRVLEYEIDFAASEARQVWSYASTPSVYTFVLGEPTRLANGDVFVNWSAAGQLDRVSPSGDLLWRVNMPIGYVFGFHTLAETLQPAI